MQSTWTLNNIPLPSPTRVQTLVHHFSNLLILRLRSIMLDDDVMLALSQPDRRPLQCLSILVTYTREEKITSIKTVSAEAWKRLKKFSPDIKIDFTIMTQVPYIELAALLKPEIPLTAICFMRHSRCTDSTISSLTNKYRCTLKKFIDYTDSTGCDSYVLSMAEECEQLDYLVYNGSLKQTTVMSLAQVKGKQWLRFGVNIDNVITAVPQRSNDNEDDDDDIILKMTNGGHYSTPIMRYCESEEDNMQSVRLLTENLKQYLGYRWQPFTQKLFS
ncbi:hypothetical protein LSH36_41g10019 [Paralvinella palmiformis]|uniref:Uncharacterized protein n=1 Tax=Paralvinella palmiformis TaxID=53620 RepID=A0AAD9K6Y9_9ANNE|nr:hypothetical protein LSH36_41g10019 [Paralvinella palmiformis]